MSLVIANGIKAACLGDLLDRLNGSEIHLFHTDHTPDGTDTASTYAAIEADFTGYAALPLDSWGVPYLNGSDKGQVDHPVQTWTVTATAGANVVYGYYVLDSLGNLFFAEKRTGGGIAMSTLGDTFVVLPRFTDDDE